MRFSVVIFTCLVAAFAVAEDATVPPTESVESGNDQDPVSSFLDAVQETEGAEEVTTVVDELPPPDEDEIFPEDEKAPEDEGELPSDNEVASSTEEVELPEDETPSGTDEGVDIPDEDATKPPKPVVDDEDAVGGETEETPEVPETSETTETVDEDEGVDSKPQVPSESGSFEDPEEVVEEPEELDEDVEDFPIDHTGFDQTTEAPTMLPRPLFTPYPTENRKPSLRPVTPYVPTDDDPLEEDNEDEPFEDWGFNKETLDELEKDAEGFAKDAEELAHDRRVVIALSTVFGIMFFFSVFVAYQMLENPNGICASLCRISVAFWCGITRCICYPCRAMCGCTGSSQSNRQDHMMLPNDGHFTHDLELS